MGQIGFVEYPPAGIKLPITLAPRTDQMSCTYAGKKYEHTDIRQLKALVLAAIKASLELSWAPIIIITIGTGWNTHHQTQIAIKRECRYYAYHETLGHRAVSWQIKPENRLTQAEPFDWPGGSALTLPNQRDRGTLGMTYYLAHDPETWEALEEIEQYLLLAQKKLLTTLRNAESIKTTLQTCQLLFDAFTTQSDEASDSLP